VNEKRPDIEDGDVISAWKSAIVVRRRNYSTPSHYVAAGLDSKGRMLQMVAVELNDGTFEIYHAMRLTQKMQDELGL